MATQYQVARSMDGHVKSDKFDYSQSVFAHPSYRHIQVFPNTFGQAISINSSQTPVVFNIPPEVFNFAESYLSGVLAIGAPTAGSYVWTYADVCYGIIAHIQHYASTNQFIVDLDNVQNYIKVVVKREISLADFLSLDVLNGLYPSGTLNNVVPAERNGVPAGGLASSLSYVEPAYFQVGALGAAVSINFQIPMRLFKNTALAIDKDVYYGQLSYLKLYMGPIQKVCYMSTSNANPSAGTPAAYAAAVAGTAVTITGLTLYLAVESNLDVREQVISAVSAPGGLSYYIPSVQAYKNSNTGTSQNISLQLDIGSGQSLMKLYHAIFSNTESLDTSYDCSNFGTAAGAGTQVGKVATYFTQLNGKRNQDITIDCSDATGVYTDYMLIRPKLKGSPIQNHNIFQYNWFHLDDYSEYGATADQEGRPMLLAGYPLGGSPLTWTYVGLAMNATAAIAYQHYDWAVYSKKLTMSPGLVTCI